MIKKTCRRGPSKVPLVWLTQLGSEVHLLANHCGQVDGCADWLHSIKAHTCSWERLGSPQAAGGRMGIQIKCGIGHQGKGEWMSEAHNGKHPFLWVTCNRVPSPYLSEKQI